MNISSRVVSLNVNKQGFKSFIFLMLFLTLSIFVDSQENNREIGLSIMRVIEFVTILYVLLTIKKISTVSLVAILCCITYCLISLYFAKQNSPVNQLLLEYKPIIIIIVLLLASETFPALNTVTKANISKHLTLMGIIYFSYYGIEYLITGKRAAFLYENNFEIMYLFVLFFFSSRSKILSIILFLAALFSLSRSATVIGLFILFYSSSTKAYIPTKQITRALMVVATSVVVVLIWLEVGRLTDDIMKIDRIVFFMLFLNEMGTEPITWLFGKGFGEPVSSTTCGILEYYTFAFTRDTQCYSQIFHSGNLRAIWTGGLLQFMLLTTLSNLAFKKMGLNRELRFGLIGIIILNGFSVSGFGNTFILLAVVVLKMLSTNQPRKI